MRCQICCEGSPGLHCGGQHKAVTEGSRTGRHSNHTHKHESCSQIQRIWMLLRQSNIISYSCIYIVNLFFSSFSKVLGLPEITCLHYNPLTKKHFKNNLCIFDYLNVFLRAQSQSYSSKWAHGELHYRTHPVWTSMFVFEVFVCRAHLLSRFLVGAAESSVGTGIRSRGRVGHDQV